MESMYQLSNQTQFFIHHSTIQFRIQNPSFRILILPIASHPILI